MNHSLNMSDEGRRDVNIERCTDLAIREIENLYSGSCSFDPSQTCVARHFFSPTIVNITGDVTYLWSVNVGTIIGDDDMSTCEVWVTSDVTIPIEVTLTITDDVATATLTQEFISTHTSTETCIHAEDGTGEQGYRLNELGLIDPNVDELPTGERISEITWMPAGEFTIGLEGAQIGGVATIEVTFNGASYNASWDGTNYTLTNTVLTDELVDLMSLGENLICFVLDY